MYVPFLTKKTGIDFDVVTTCACYQMIHIYCTCILSICNYWIWHVQIISVGGGGHFLYLEFNYARMDRYRKALQPLHLSLKRSNYYNIATVIYPTLTRRYHRDKDHTIFHLNFTVGYNKMTSIIWPCDWLLVPVQDTKEDLGKLTHMIKSPITCISKSNSIKRTLCSFELPS